MLLNNNDWFYKFCYKLEILIHKNTVWVPGFPELSTESPEKNPGKLFRSLVLMVQQLWAVLTAEHSVINLR